MESYLNSWENIMKEYQSFSRSKNKLKMKNSLEVEAAGEKVSCKESRGDSLPIHCVIQTFSSLKDLKSNQCEHCEGKGNSCDSWWECDCEKNEMSGCIALPEDTSMCDLVRMALIKLGFPASLSSFATGSILIRNWKPLPLDVICHDMKKTIGDILGEITAVISLRIQIFKPKITTAQKMKDSLLLHLINTNQTFLRDTRCPFDMGTLTKLCDHSTPLKMQLLQEPTEDLSRKFETWLEDLQKAEKATACRKTLFSGFLSPNKTPNSSNHLGKEKRVLSPNVDLSTRDDSGHQKLSSEKDNIMKETFFGLGERPKHILTPKTRVRTSFDPEFELPKLQKWFLKNPHPSRQQIYDYVSELNSLESRKGRKQLDVNNVVYWFKNARAAQKRSECRRTSNAIPMETNRCNLLKIPLGVTSDDQRSVSEDESSITSESGDDCREENGRCLQVVGKWNSNGQGEAVLEMQIPSRKNEFSQSSLQVKKEKENEGEIKEEINNQKQKNSEKKEFLQNLEKNPNQTETQSVNGNGMEENANPLKKTEISGNKNIGKCEEIIKNEISSKVQMKTNFPSFKENANVNENEFLPSYKPGFPVSQNSVVNSSLICMSQYIGQKTNNLSLSSEERRKRNRTFIDPVTEVPRLEQWFRLSTHPSHSLIARYTEELNNMPYRRKFPKLEAKNVQFWFKNRRAKNKRLNYLETNNN